MRNRPFATIVSAGDDCGIGISETLGSMFLIALLVRVTLIDNRDVIRKAGELWTR